MKTSCCRHSARRCSIVDWLEMLVAESSGVPRQWHQFDTHPRMHGEMIVHEGMPLKRVRSDHQERKVAVQKTNVLRILLCCFFPYRAHLPLE